jgi:hypothetical protein
LGKGNAEQYTRLRSSNAREKAFQPHSGIEDDGNSTDFEKRECGRDQWKALPNHDQGSITRHHATRAKVCGPGFDFGVEGRKREREVIDIATGSSAAWDFKCGAVRLTRCHQGQVLRDIGGGGHFSTRKGNR